MMTLTRELHGSELRVLRAASNSLPFHPIYPDTRRNRGLILAGLGLVTGEPYTRDHLAMYRFVATPLGLKVLKKHVGSGQ